MPMRVLFVICMVGLMAAIALLTIRETAGFRRGRSLLSGRQLVIRMLSGVILLGLLVKVTIGGLQIMSPDVDSIRFALLYWTECVVLGYFVCLVGFVDLWLVWRCRRQHRRWITGTAARLCGGLASAEGHMPSLSPGVGPGKAERP